MKKVLLITILIFLAIVLIFFNSSKEKETISSSKTSITNINSKQKLSKTSIFAKNLEVPWAITFLPDRNLLVTERSGKIKIIDKNGNANPPPLEISEVKQIGEGGLLGITLHPDFEVNNQIYIYYTYESLPNQNTLNRVVRYKLENKKLVDKTVIVDKIPGAPNHNGGRIKFGPDRLLYITTGDAQEPSFAQDKNSLAGKILRVNPDGKIPEDNPFGNEVYSYGHRNPQGLAWDEKGQLYEAEHGPQANDEINLIEKGKNYGWPIIQGNQKQQGMENPIIHSGNSTWAPSGLAYFNGSLFFAGLRGQAIFELNLNNKTVKEHFKNEFGRIREVILDKENLLHITTSNLDGRGIPKIDDDKIIILPFL